jgi:hypothetical protein
MQYKIVTQSRILLFLCSCLFVTNMNGSAGEESGWWDRFKTYVEKKVEKIKPSDVDDETFRSQVLGNSETQEENKKVENPRTDQARREDKILPELSNMSNTAGTNSGLPDDQCNPEPTIVENLLQIAMKDNKHIFFFCVATGALLAVIFPQQTKSMFHRTTSKMKRLLTRVSEFFTCRTQKETVEEPNRSV